MKEQKKAVPDTTPKNEPTENQKTAATVLTVFLFGIIVVVAVVLWFIMTSSAR